MARIVAALGGNALGTDPQGQRERAAATAKALIELIKQGHELVISHGNGPQVGMIQSATGLPLPECTAMSQGYIGYHLQNAMEHELHDHGVGLPIIAMVTEVEVSPDDPAFSDPTKPIGIFLTEDEAKKRMSEDPTVIYKEDSGRGWRKVVPSPMPIGIIEKDCIIKLIESGCIPITCGGGGIPVVKTGEDYRGVEAVIDKDFASEILAEAVNADYLLILTAVDRVCINFNTPEQQELSELSVESANALASGGHFAAGSMLPKVQAAVRFASSGADRRAVICSLDNAAKALSGESGTVINA